MSHAAVGVCPLFTGDAILVQVPSSWWIIVWNYCAGRWWRSNIFKMPFCQKAAWLEVGTEKRTVIKGRSHLFLGVCECSFWQHRKRLGWQNKLCCSSGGSCSSHYSQTISNTPEKTAGFLPFFLFVCIKQAKHKHTKMNRVCTLQLKHWMLFGGLFQQVLSIIGKFFQFFISFFLLTCKTILHSYIAQGEPVPLLLGSGWNNLNSRSSDSSISNTGNFCGMETLQEPKSSLALKCLSWGGTEEALVQFCALVWQTTKWVTKLGSCKHSTKLFHAMALCWKNLSQQEQRVC